MSDRVGVLVRVVPEPPKGDGTGPIILSLVLQPDDKAQLGSGGIRLEDWPVAIANALSEPARLYGCDGFNPETLLNPGDTQASSNNLVNVRSWIPLASSADSEIRQKLWIQAVGKNALQAFADDSGSHFVAERRNRTPSIYSSPVDRLALTMGAVTATSVVAQMAAHVSNDKADLAGRANPLAPSSLQSQILFRQFAGARPDAPAQPPQDKSLADTLGLSGDAKQLENLTEDYGAAAANTVKIVLKMEEFARADKAPPKRFDMIRDGDLPRDQKNGGGVEKTRSTPPRYGRVSAAMHQILQAQVLLAKGKAGGGHYFGMTKTRKRSNPEPYYLSAAAAFAGQVEDPESVKQARIRGEHSPTDDYANYLLALQPDDKKAARARIDADTTATAEQAASALRTIAGMYSYPQLAAYFGLLVDIEIDRSIDISKLRYIRVVLPGLGANQANQLWTAVEAKNGRLQPRPYGSGNADPMISNGLLELGNKERFGIISLDVNSAIEGSFSAARNDNQSRLDGASINELSSSMPSQRGVGLGILDRLRRDIASAETEARHPSIQDPGHSDQILYLEDLVTGYRIDVQTELVDGTKFDWLSLMDREVEFPEIAKAMADAGLDPSLLSRVPDWAGDRLAGMVQTMHREIQTDGGDPDATVFETLATWRNWSLAVPAMKSKTSLLQGDIQLERKITPKAGSLPPLRFGAKVRFAARCTLINGSSLTLNDAKSYYAHESATYVLSDGAGVPDSMLAASGRENDKPGFPVLRHEPLATPRVFLSGLQTDLAPSHREIVVSTEPGSKLAAKDARVVLPGELSFDAVELHGTLDKFDRLPPTPFQNLELTPPLGKAPGDVSALLNNVDGGVVASYPDPLSQFLCVAFTEEGMPAEEFGFAPPKLIDLYGTRAWPNAAALRLELAAVRSEALPLNGRIFGDFDLGSIRNGMANLQVRLAPAEEIEVSVWPLAGHLLDYLQFAPVVAAAQLASFKEAFETGFASRNGDAKTLPAVLDAFSKASPLEKSGSAFDIPIDDPLDSNDYPHLLLRALRRLPIPSVSSHQTVRLVHAVKIPILTPAFINLWAVHSPAPDPAITDNEAAIRKAWAAELLTWDLDADEQATKQDMFEQAQRSQTPHSNRIFIGGALTFHRKSTSRIDITAVWQDYRDDIAPRRRDGRYCFVPEPHVQTLTTLDSIPYRTEGKIEARDLPTKIGLAQSAELNPTYLGFTFRDTRARRLTVNARALSRFKSHFARSDTENDDTYTVSSENTAGGDREIVVLSTDRPKPLNEPFCVPSLHYSIGEYDVKDSTNGAKGRFHHRTVRMRFDLGDRFYSSGYEERVGVVCWPPDLFAPKNDPNAAEHPLVRTIKVDNIEPQILATVRSDGGDIPRGAANYATRWGRDPIHASGDLPALIPGTAFRSTIDYVQNVSMPLPQKKKLNGTLPPLATLPVSLALYEPVLDPDTGRFYVDVEIDQDMTYEPWVNIGLVRYQKHSLEGYECSLPIRAMVRIPADRHLDLEVDDAGEISVRYSGVGYIGTRIPGAVRKQRYIDARKPGGSLRTLYPLETSTLSVTVLRDDGGASGAPLVLVPMPPPAGGDAPVPDGLPHITKLRPRVTDGIAEWVIGRFAGGASPDPMLRRLVLPGGIDRSEVSIWVTEHEHLAADDHRRTFGTSRTTIDGFEEPLSWSDSVALDNAPDTIVTARVVSAVHIRLRTSDAGGGSEPYPGGR
ncbi:hypothetical protein FJ945_19625 [Mesorhizobium sp. B2-4-9]|uniref:hypothetical protein n=1 Tax=Mesorhizobium sp. B2-4-9 TaxID=2589940 RepID=UPI001128AADD|nr:hypothetical protein [Mesorhizobium sp. B2-4-9]TPL20957.1 hypothetical protein FJ945_19625 [Mesorhizobium sp. B2-4-9]